MVHKLHMIIIILDLVLLSRGMMYEEFHYS